MQLQTTTIVLTPNDIYGLNTPYVLLPSLSQTEFYDIDKITWKLIYNSIPYQYIGDLYFCIGNEYIAKFQSNSITSMSSIITILKSPLYKEYSPIITPGSALTLQCTDFETCRVTGLMPSPINGDSNVTININYYVCIL